MELGKRIEKIWVNKIHPTYEGKRKFLIKCGAKIGENTRLNCLTSAFGSEPYLVECGQDCLFAWDVHFLTHDGGIKVLNSLGYFATGGGKPEWTKSHLSELAIMFMLVLEPLLCRG